MAKAATFDHRQARQGRDENGRLKRLWALRRAERKRSRAERRSDAAE